MLSTYHIQITHASLKCQEQTTAFLSKLRNKTLYSVVFLCIDIFQHTDMTTHQRKLLHGFLSCDKIGLDTFSRHSILLFNVVL